jgi:multisubunit Na+/H+ antiporter MnhF subunit
VNVWLVAGAATLAQLAFCLVTMVRGAPLDRLVGLELGGTVTTLGLLLLAEGFDRSIYFDVALAYAAASFFANLTFVRFLERWV